MTRSRPLLASLGVRVVAGTVELRGITDDILAELADLAVSGIHDPDFMPFSTPWTDTRASELPTRFAQHHWGTRASFSREKWSLDLAVFHDDELVGSQGLSTEDFLVTRTGETGSWLARRFQGRGIGTAMRQAICSLAFDHLDFTEITSGAFVDNAASLAVSRKVGYRPNGVVRMKRRDGMAPNQQLLLTPDTFVPGPHPLVVSGVNELRAAIGLS